MGQQVGFPWPFPWGHAIALVRYDASQPKARPCGCRGDRGAHRDGCMLRKRAGGVGVIQDTISARAMRVAAHRWFRARRQAAGKRHFAHGCAHVANVFFAQETENHAK